MKHFFLLLLLLVCGNFLHSQEKSLPTVKEKDTALLRKKKPITKPVTKDTEPPLSIADYKIISYARDTTFLDTTLTIQKEYRYNYLRKDDFELMPFANVGQPYNKLGVDLTRYGNVPYDGGHGTAFQLPGSSRHPLL